MTITKLPFCAERPHSTRPRTGDARWQAHQVSRLINSTPIDGYRPFANKKTHSALSICFWPEMNESHHGAISTKNALVVAKTIQCSIEF